jgi:hypothetical protein
MDINMNSITGIPYSSSNMNNIATNPIVLIVIVVVIIAYYLLFSTIGSVSGNTSSNSSGNGILFMEVLLCGIFVLLVIMNGMTYFFNIDITASIKNIFTSNPEIDIIVDPDNISGDNISTVPELKLSKQVFHVPGNKYGYDDAKAMCRAYGGRLATIKEVQKSHDKGADWCSFGWSDGQMALYPTQYDKWAYLQGVEGHEHDCGRPGINGGYIANPNVRFGVNCYGYKPKITQDEALAMETTPQYPVTVREKEFDSKVDYWRNHLSEIEVAPFNHNNWSVI